MSTTISITPHGTVVKPSAPKAEHKEKVQSPTLAQPALEQDTFSLQHQVVPVEQVIQQTETLLEQAKTKPFPSQKLLDSHKALENTLKLVQDHPSIPKEIKQQQVQALSHLLEQNKQLRKDLAHKKTVQPEGYTRPMSKVEQDSMKQLFSDLTHPDPEMAKAAKELLLGLGMSEERIAKIRKAMQEHKSKQVQFGGGDSLEELLADAQKDIVNNNSMEKIVQAGVTQHVNASEHAVQPILFGQGHWGPPRHLGSPVHECYNPMQCPIDNPQGPLGSITY